MANTVIVSGTSEPYDFQLRNNGAVLDGTGFTLALEVYRGTTLLTTGVPTAAWLAQASGTVRVSGINQLATGSYRVRYKLTDVGGKVGYVPNQAVPDTWSVVKVT